MTKEVLRQGDLFTGQLVETVPPYVIEALAQGAVGLLTGGELPAASGKSIEPVQIEPERPKATLRDMRAVRSLLYNRLLLEVVQRRIEKAEAIIHSYLLAWGDSTAQIGPYLVELDDTKGLFFTQTETDGWKQLRLPEADGNPVEELGEETSPLARWQATQA